MTIIQAAGGAMRVEAMRAAAMRAVMLDGRNSVKTLATPKPRIAFARRSASRT
jgi:hypothetical protein